MRWIPTTRTVLSKAYTQMLDRMLMKVIHNENDYHEVMKRIDQLCCETDEDTPIDDPRLQELDTLAALVETYEQQIMMGEKD